MMPVLNCGRRAAFGFKEPANRELIEFSGADGHSGEMLKMAMGAFRKSPFLALAAKAFRA